MHNNATCLMPTWFWRASDLAFEVTYYYAAPIYIVLGLLGHGLCLSICWKERKSEYAYFYQIVLAVSDLLTVATSGLWYTSIACNGLVGAERTGPVAEWFRSQYGLVWFFAHLASPIMNVFFTSSLLLAVFMAVDRVFALAKPYAYRTTAHRRRQVWTIGVCAVLSVATSVFDCSRRTVQEVHTEKGRSYKAVYDEAYLEQPYVPILSHVRNILRILGLLALIVCNAILVHFYRSRFLKIGHGNPRQATEATRKEAETTVFVLVLYQSISNAISMSCLTIYYFLFYIMPNFPRCGVFLMSPMMNLACMLTYGLDFYIVLIMSRRCRQLVARQFCCVSE